MAERSLSLRASDDYLLVWNEMETTFLLLRKDKDTMVEVIRMVSNLSDSYILHLQPPHFLTESGEGVHLWQLEEEPTRGVLTHSLNVDTFSLELGVLFHPFCALTISTNVANWHDGWAVQVKLKFILATRIHDGITDINRCGTLRLSNVFEDFLLLATSLILGQVWISYKLSDVFKSES